MICKLHKIAAIKKNCFVKKKKQEGKGECLGKQKEKTVKARLRRKVKKLKKLA